MWWPNLVVMAVTYRPCPDVKKVLYAVVYAGRFAPRAASPSWWYPMRTPSLFWVIARYQPTRTLRICSDISDRLYFLLRIGVESIAAGFVLSTGWFKHKTPNSFRVRCPRRFWEMDPEFMHTCLMCPCRAFYESFFFFFSLFRQVFGFLIFFGIFGS